MISVFVAAVFTLLGVTDAAPGPKPGDNAFKFPITFENGKLGVNFLGFHAAAGLGGLITGNDADGGLQAEAGTPFGQKAWAGLGGGVNGAGRSTGGLYAGATAGGGIGAKAGLGGTAGPNGNFGTSYAGASAGGLYKSRVKSIGQPPVDAGIQEEFNGPVDESNIQVLSKKEVNIKKTSTVTIPPKVPEYINNFDVREEESSAPPPAPPLPQYPIYVEKTKYKARRRPHHFRKHVVVTNGFVPPSIQVPVTDFGEGSLHGTGSVSVTKKVVPSQIVNDAFNVPISTLNAVSQLVGSFAKGIDGSATITKSVGINTEHSSGVNIGGTKSIGVNTDYDTGPVSVNVEASKPVATINIEASKQFKHSSSF